MHRRAAVTLVGLVGLVVVVIGPGCRRPQPPPVDLEPKATRSLVFPPPDEGWQPREPLPKEILRRHRPGVEVTHPVLDDAGKFEMEGQTVRVWFSEELVSDEGKKKAPVLTITPAVRGKTVWSGSSLEFTADKPFDPDTEYALSLPEMTAPSGRKLEGGFRATFKATPSIEIAGKTITYLPKPGHARVVAVLPSSDVIGPTQDVAVIYDQPVDLGLARKLVTLEGEGETPLASTLRHPSSNVYDGQKVDPRFVVLARAAPPLRAGQSFEVEAKPQTEGDGEAKSSTFNIAPPLALEAITCSGGAEPCEVEGTTIRGPQGASIHLRFNNLLPYAWDDTKRLLKIEPTPRNLYASGWSNELDISAAFDPGATYTIRTAQLADAYGGSLAPVSLTFQTRALPASATMPESVLILDEANTNAFAVTTRNVEKAELLLWPVPKGDDSAFREALAASRARRAPTAAPLVVEIAPEGRRDAFGESLVNLSGKVEPDRAYQAQLRITKTAHGALESRVDGTASTPFAVLHTAGPSALGAHVHRTGDRALVQVFRLASGAPVQNARVSVGSATAMSDAQGSALVDLPASAPPGELVASISAPDAALLMPLETGATNSSELFADLAAGESAPRELSGMLLTDRGVYRPGSKVFVKGFLRTLQGGAVRPVANRAIRVRLVDPLGTDVLDAALKTNDRGTVGKEIQLERGAHTGRFQLRLELDDGKHTVVSEQSIRVADFEAPKFKVDVEKAADTGPDKVHARVVGRYLFGAPASGAAVGWVLKRVKLPVNGGALGDAGLVFDDDRASWWWDEAPAEAPKPITGDGKLGEDGTLDLDVAAGPLDGPTELTLEADVADASNRHVSGRLRVTRDPIGRHPGVALGRSFGSAGPLPVTLGVVDAAGNAVAGVKVSARIERLTWTRTAERAESGATVERWKDVATPAGECEVTTGTSPVKCELPVDRQGSYRIVAHAFGRDGGAVHYYAWRADGPAEEREAVPSSGKKLPVVLDRRAYKAGDTAKVLVQSPYPAALAVLTVESGGLLRHEARHITGPAVTFDVPVTAAHAPFTHAVVTLLPIGSREAEYRVGAVRIPVALDAARLAVTVASAKPSYEAKGEAEITVEVKKGGAPLKNTDVTLAVVDEGVLRMTGFHPPDPAATLRPGRGLAFKLTDSRRWLMTRREKAHAPGGGDSQGEDALDARRDFVETAAWLPDLVTDEHGRVTVKVKLPDNLTEFRMTAVGLDDAGLAGVAESSFVVTKPLMLEAVMPRFALRGDTFEAAAMVHNNTDAKVDAKVTLAGQTRDVSLAPKSHQRVAVPMTADRVGTSTKTFALEALGALRDKVELPLRIEEPGVDEHPQLAGVFTSRQEVTVTIPADALFEPDAALSIKTGSALYPEFGQRLTYLLDYPHGCVEQTTSSTIPLLAARTLLPWTGVTSLEPAEIQKRIEAGVERLASMRTSSGGLAYWPGGSEPHLYGSTYAMRLLVRAREAGITRPGLVENLTKYLVDELSRQQDDALKAQLAEALALAKALPAGAADGLWDTRAKLDASGLASLALALSSLDNQGDRVRELLDALEAAFDDDGTSKSKHDAHDWEYWGTSDRDRAQATIALTRLRPTSKRLPVLAKRLSRGIDTYTTQSTAWSLLALSDYVGAKSPSGSVDVKVKMVGHVVDTYKRLGGDNKEVRVPLRELAGKTLAFELEGDGHTPTAFAMDAHYKRPLAAEGGHVARRAKHGVTIHRFYSDPSGKPVDISKVKAGQVVRVALRVQCTKMDEWRRAYAAVTDRLPAGFEPVEPDLATTASVPDISREHPLYDALRGGEGSASHVDLRDDRVQLYFDHMWGPTLAATYLARATTPGTFALPPASGELMYEQGSEGFSDAAKVVIEP